MSDWSVPPMDLADRISRGAVAALDLAPLDPRFAELSRQVLTGGASRFAVVVDAGEPVDYVVPVGVPGASVSFGALVVQRSRAGVIWRDAHQGERLALVTLGPDTHAEWTPITLGGEQWARFDLDDGHATLSFLTPPTGSPELRATLALVLGAGAAGQGGDTQQIPAVPAAPAPGDVAGPAVPVGAGSGASPEEPAQVAPPPSDPVPDFAPPASPVRGTVIAEAPSFLPRPTSPTPAPAVAPVEPTPPPPASPVPGPEPEPTQLQPAPGAWQPTSPVPGFGPEPTQAQPAQGPWRPPSPVPGFGPPATAPFTAPPSAPRFTPPSHGGWQPAQSGPLYRDEPRATLPQPPMPPPGATLPRPVAPAPAPVFPTASQIAPAPTRPGVSGTLVGFLIGLIATIVLGGALLALVLG